MKHPIAHLALIAALGLPGAAVAQPGGDGHRPGPRERDTDRPEHGERPDRGDRPERGGDRPEHREREGNRKPLPVEMVAEAIATIRELHANGPAEWIGRLEAVAKEDPERAARHLARFPRIMELIDARKNRPEEFALHVERTGLMREVMVLRRDHFVAQRDQDEGTMKSLRGQIRERIAGLFRIRIEMKRLEIQRMRDQLSEAEQELAEIEEATDEQIEEKLTEMLDKRRGPRGGEGKPQRDRPGGERPGGDAPRGGD